MKTICVILILFSLICNSASRAQQLSIDSLFGVIKNSQTLKEKYEAVSTALYQIDNFNRENKFLDSLDYILRELLLKIYNNRDTIYLANILHMRGQVFSSASKFDSCIYYFNEALKFHNPLTDQAKIAECYSYLSDANGALGHYNTAVTYFFKVVEIYEQIHDTVNLNNTYYDLAVMYLKREQEPQKVIEYSSKQVSPHISLDPINYCLIVEAYLQLQMPDSALHYLIKAKPVLESPYQFQPPYYFRALASYYNYIGQFDSASFYFIKAINGLEQVHQEGNSVKCFFHLGQIANQKNNLKLAKNYYQTAEARAIKYNRYFDLPHIYFGLSEVYEKMHQPEKAYLMLKSFKLAVDSLKKNQQTDILLSTDLQHQFSVKEEKLKQEQLRKEFEKEALVKQQKQIKIFAFAAIFAILLFGIYRFYHLRKRKKLENQQSLLNERLRISRELHDDMGSTLGSISQKFTMAEHL